MIKILELKEIGLSVNVHSIGKIETLQTNKIRSNGRADNRRGVILNPKIDRYGYEQITLSNDGLRKCYTVHRLVAMAYIDNPENKPTVNHIDGVKTNNNVNNLEWATHKEQYEHKVKLGSHKNNEIALAKSNERKSKAIIYEGVLYKSIHSAALSNGVSRNKVLNHGTII